MLIFLLASLLPSPAFAACPTLSGTFQCTRDGVAMPGEVILDTSDSGFKSYDFQESASPQANFSFTADGQQHPAPANLLSDGTYVASCPNGAAVFVMQGPSGPATFLIETWAFSATSTGVNILLRDVIRPALGPEHTFTSRIACTGTK